MLPIAENWKRENAIRPESGLRNALRQLTIEELGRHKLLGLSLSRGWLEPGQASIAEKRLLENLRREALASAVLDELARELMSASVAMPVGLLKGTALWGDLYRPGEREVTDIDLFVGQRDEARLLEILSKLGFSRQERSHERASRFKTVCLSERYGDLSLEVHTKLWWREPPGFEWQWRPSLRAPFSRLTLEDQLLHLCGHWIAQHTMISLHWLLDIALFIEQYGSQLDDVKLLARARELRISRAVETARRICNWREPRIDLEFLRNPRGQLGRYFWLKHTLQDSWRDAIYYDVTWLSARLFRSWR
jgi:hypothetical protein